ncbi:hemagglutinin repeat-containing protein [Pandoraea sp. NPDC090278]|uniref:two-partner secretion domain-containing protein n=1 Tax=Pandoraea sp. NPDC090278 TaxID=3364391 RepID=UPI00383BBBEC
MAHPVTTFAQIVAAPGPHAPGVSTTPNGLPLVNITSPTAAGVSQNQYHQFDVPTQGAILNNSRTIVQTQTGGLVPGNPNLAGDPARIIVNQVTSTLPSNVAGYLEVAGQRAEVIISNPNGLTCNGCGFINVPRGVLTTGLPVFGGSGSLEAFRVTGGLLKITGNGLNGSNLENTALLARAVEINAAVHAQRLDVITGLNDVDAATFEVRHSTQAEGGRPTFALDVSRLGGMYAGKIRLIGTEAGVGVNMDGHVAASRGTVVLNNAGQVQIAGKLHASEDIHARADGSLSVSGEMISDGALDLASARELISAGTLRSRHDMTLGSGGTWRHTGVASTGGHFSARAGALASAGMIASGANPDGTSGSPGDVSVSASGLLQSSGTFSSTGNLELSGDAIDLSDASLTALHGMRVHARIGDISMVRATTTVGDAIHMAAAKTIDHDSATLKSAALFMEAVALSNRRGTVSQWGKSPVQIKLSGLLNNRDGRIQINGLDLSLTAAHVDNISGRIEHAGTGELHVRAASIDNGQGTIATNGDLSAVTDAWRNTSGSISAKRSLSASIQEEFRNDAGLIQSGSKFSLSADIVENRGGRMLALGDDLHLRARDRIHNAALNDTKGEIAGNANVFITTVDLSNSDALAAQNSLIIDVARRLLNLGGTITAQHDVTLSVRNALDNSDGSILAGDKLALRADQVVNARGQLEARSLFVDARQLDNRSGAVRQTANRPHDASSLRVGQSLDNRGGTIHFGAHNANIDAVELDTNDGDIAHAGSGTITITGATIANRGGRIRTNGDLQLDGGEIANGRGHLSSRGSMTVNTAHGLDNTSGLIAGKRLSLNVGGALNNHTGLIEANDALSLDAQAFDNTAGRLQNAGQELTKITVRNALKNTDGGRVAANADIELGVGTFDNRGGRLSGNTLVLKASSDVINDAGHVIALKGLSAMAGRGFFNHSGLVSVHDMLTLAVEGDIDNGSGRFEIGAPNGRMLMSGRRLDNENGSLLNAGNGAIDIVLRERLRNVASARSAANRGGNIAGNGAVNVHAGGVDNLDGARIEAGTALTIASTKDINNQRGQLHANEAITASAEGDFGNVSGEVHSGTALKLTTRGALNNTDGSLEIGSAAADASTTANSVVSITAASIDNTDGRIVNGGQGDLTLVSDSLANARTSDAARSHSTGLIGGNGRLSITTYALTNGPSAQITSGTGLALAIRDTLTNDGTIFSNEDLTLSRENGEQAGSFTNGGVVQARRDASLAVERLEHKSGEISVNRTLDLRTNQLSGTAGLRAGGDMNIALPGDFVYGPNHIWKVGGNLTLGVGGALGIHGLLEANKVLKVTATRVLNSQGGRLRASSVIVDASGDFINETRVDGDDIRLRSTALRNRGSILGHRIRFDGARVENTGEPAVIAATQQLDIFASGEVVNQTGATLFSLGQLRIAAGDSIDAEGLLTEQTARLVNRSATIEAGGDIDIATRDFINDRSYINVTEGEHESTVQTIRDVWIAGYIALPDPNSRERCAAHTGSACEELPTVHTSHSLSVDGEPPLIGTPHIEIDINGRTIETTKLIPNPRNQSFTQWRWGREARAAHSAEKLRAVGAPISVTIPKRGLTALDTAGKTFSLEKPIIEVSLRRGSFSEYDTRNITRSAVQHFESITDDGHGNWIIQFWPDYDPARHILPTVVDQSGQAISGAPDEGVRIFRRGHGISDGRDTNEYRRSLTVHSRTDVLGDVAAPGVITSQGTIRLNVDNGTALNHASTISAGGDLKVRGNDGQITSRSVGLKRVERIEQVSDLYWHEKSGNSDSWFTSVSLPGFERTTIVGGLSSLISSNQATRLRGRDITIETAAIDGTVIGSRNTDSGVNASSRVSVNSNVESVSASTRASVDTLNETAMHPKAVGAIQTLDAISGGIPGITLPRSALFQVISAPDHPYLIETDPRFTERGTLVSSNYMLDLLGIDPSAVERRIGDGFYEAKLIREQILKLTGQATSGKDDTLIRNLLAQGARAGRDLELRIGIRLTAEQMKALTDDIVWLVRQTVTLPDGTTQEVLVPTVYLAHGKRVTMQPGGALVAGSDVHIEATNLIDNAGQIAGRASTRLTADDVRNLGTIGGAGNKGKVEVVAARDITNIGGDISGRDVDVIAGRDVVFENAFNTFEWRKGSQGGATTSIESLGNVSATRSVSVSAGRDLTVVGAAIDAGEDLKLTAGRDISLGASALQRDFGGGTQDNHNQTRIKEHVASQITAGEHATLIAGRDLTASGARVGVDGNIAIVAGRDVKVDAVLDSIQDAGRVRSSSYSTEVDSYEETARGTQLLAGKGIGIAAGQAAALSRLLEQRGVSAYVSTDKSGTGDVTILGAYLSAGGDALDRSTTKPVPGRAGKSDIQITATGDITVGGVAAQYDDVRWTQRTSNGLLSSTTETTHRERDGTRTTGSTLSGDAVSLVSGRDIAIAGSHVIADNNVVLGARRNIDISSTEDRGTSLSSSEKTTTGVFGGGTSFTIGSRTEKDKQQREQVNQTGSLVGAVNGDVMVRAGKDFRQEGSTVLARDGSIEIAAKRVAIVESQDSEKSVHEREVKQSGLTVAVSNPLLSAAETLGQMGKAVGKVNDSRMKALGVAAGGLAIKNAADSVKNLQDAANVNISVTVGGSKQQSRETNDSTTSTGSTVRAGRNIAIHATGDGNQSSMQIRGSTIEAGDNVTLASDGALDILASTDTAEHHRTSSGVSGGIGLGIALGTKGSTIGVTANASLSRGKADGSDVTHRSSHIKAGNVAEISSGGDTNIRGGTVSGERVIARVDGDLNIESLQDTSRYQSKDQSKDQSISGSGTVGFGGASGSINVSHQQINSDFASVVDQAGIKAGDAGFDVTVKGNTDLTGAVIASTEKAVDANRNRLKTGSLTTRDIENHAEYDAFGISLGGGISTGGGDNAKVGTDQKGDAQTGANATPGTELPKTGPVSVAPPIVVAAGDSASSVTRSGVSGAEIEITDEARQLDLTGKTAEEAIADVNRDVSSDRDGSNALANKFDKEQIEAGFEIVRALQREVGTFVTNRAKEFEALKEARKKETDPVKIAALDGQIQDAAKWAPGGRYRQIVTVMAAAAGGNVTAGTGEFLQRAAVGYLQTLAVEQVKQIADSLGSESARTALHGIVGCAGGVAAGGNCGAGAMGGAASVVLGNLLNQIADTRNDELPQQDKEARMNLIESVVAGITAGTGNDATTASIASRLELENNQFTLPQGVVKAGAAAASLGEFMSQNGASAKEIQKAQTDLLEWVGTDVPQPATLLLKNWAILMGSAPALAPGAATATGMAVGGTIGGTANLLVQKALNGEQEMSKVDVLIAIANGALTQGRGIIATTSISTAGAAIGATIKGDAIGNASMGATVGAAVGGRVGSAASDAARSVATPAVTDAFGAIVGAVVSEVTTTKAQEKLNTPKEKK